MKKPMMLKGDTNRAGGKVEKDKASDMKRPNRARGGKVEHVEREAMKPEGDAAAKRTDRPARKSGGPVKKGAC